MSTYISIEFPWGRYHANPWTRATNEGAAEWPPSPWRLLRALYSSWKLHAPDLAADEVEPLLARLCAPPTFWLPRRSEAHTRHYLPGVSFRGDVKLTKTDKPDTDKTLDAFVAMQPGSRVVIEWDIELEEIDRQVLARLCGGVRYLGRAESIVEVELMVEPDTTSLMRSEAGAAEGAFVLAPTGPEAMSTLLQSPAEVRKQRRLLPEHSEVLTYPVDNVAQPRRTTTRPTPADVHAVRFVVNGSVHPSRFEALAVGDLMHRALTKLADGGEHSPTLTGCSADGSPLRDGHQHAHFFGIPGLDNCSGRRLDSIVAWAPSGFDERERDVLARLKRLSSNRQRGFSSLDLTLVDAGSIESVAPELVTSSSVWESVTPYAPVLRHDGELDEQLLADVQREASNRGLPSVQSVKRIDGPWLQYRRYRPGREKRERSRPAYGLRIELADAVEGPIAFGQLSHYGLGLFRPVAT